MVLLPGCACCPVASCNNLRTYYNSATSLELDIEAYDWERDDVYLTTDFCGLPDGSTVTGRTSLPWAAINGSYSLSKIFSNSFGSTWRYEFTSPCSGVFGFFDPPRVDVAVSSAGLSFTINYIRYNACDYLGGAITDTCTVNSDVECSGSPAVVTQRYRRSPQKREFTAVVNCVDGVWESTAISVTSNTFPDPAFSQDIAVPSLGPCAIDTGGIPNVTLDSTSTTGDPVVKIKNLVFVF